MWGTGAAHPRGEAAMLQLCPGRGCTEMRWCPPRHLPNVVPNSLSRRWCGCCIHPDCEMGTGASGLGFGFNKGSFELSPHPVTGTVPLSSQPLHPAEPGLGFATAQGSRGSCPHPCLCQQETIPSGLLGAALGQDVVMLPQKSSRCDGKRTQFSTKMKRNNKKKSPSVSNL